MPETIHQTRARVARAAAEDAHNAPGPAGGQAPAPVRAALAQAEVARVYALNDANLRKLHDELGLVMPPEPEPEPETDDGDAADDDAAA